MGKVIRMIAVFMAIMLVGIMGLVCFYSFALPDSYFVSGSEPFYVSSLFSISSKPLKSSSHYAAASKCNKSDSFDLNKFSPITKVTDSTLMLFDSVPIKNVKEKTIVRPMLVPSGRPFGIKLMTDGVVVIKTEKLEGCCPAQDSGIRVGDIITSVNGETVETNKQISELITSYKGNPCTICYKRNEEQKTCTLTPVYSNGSYKCGMWVRDSSAGIGTLTFYDPETSAFGGLGHPICDTDTKLPLPLSEGSVGDVKITGYDKSKAGEPGQLLGEFASSAKTGNILANCDAGIFGTLYDYSDEQKAVPMGFRQEIHTGKASIYSTIGGTEPKEYEIEIEKVNLIDDSEHDMIVRVTDKELLKKTGGIVQGMSGSPIIQDGKLVGAVTHVFIDTPEQGYAIFADSMYENACKYSEQSLDMAG